MRTFFKASIVITILFSFCSCLYPITYTNKTYMSLPTPHDYLPMQYTSWHRIIKQGSSNTKPWGATMHFAPFYRMSNNTTGLGKYFGTNYKNTVKVGVTSPESDLRTDLIIHKTESASTLKGTIKLCPKHTSYGLYFSYNQELNNIHKGLFFQLNLPIQHVENDLRVSFTDEKKDATGSVCEYFTGRLRQTSSTNAQEPLCYLKLCSPTNQTGIADIEVLLGQMLRDGKEHQLSGAIKGILPTGSKPTGKYMFPAVVGNGKHWAIGAQFKGSLNVAKGDDYSLEYLFLFDYAYHFGSNEKRTLGYRNGFDDINSDNRHETSYVMAWNYYVLAGEQGKLGTFPFTNVLTQEVRVRPGSKMKAHSSFAYHRNNTTIDFGYSFYSQDGEKIGIKCWTNDKYAPAAPEYSTEVSFDVTDYGSTPPAWSIGGPIQHEMIDYNTPATPTVLKHAIHGAISYTISEWENPFIMGCGFSVDWSQDNSTATGYTLWAKAAITF